MKGEKQDEMEARTEPWAGYLKKCKNNNCILWENSVFHQIFSFQHFKKSPEQLKGWYRNNSLDAGKGSEVSPRRDCQWKR